MRSLRWLPIVFAAALSSPAVADDDDDRPMKDKPMSENAARVQTHVVPAIAGIESADKSVAALYELSGSAQLVQKDAQMTVDLATRALAMAMDRAESLDDMKGLSSDAQQRVDQAMTSLKEARTTLRKIDKQVGTKKLSLKQTEQVRMQAKEIHESLSMAEDAVEEIAKAYDVPVELEFRG